MASKDGWARLEGDLHATPGQGQVAAEVRVDCASNDGAAGGHGGRHLAGGIGSGAHIQRHGGDHAGGNGGDGMGGFALGSP